MKRFATRLLVIAGTMASAIGAACPGRTKTIAVPTVAAIQMPDSADQVLNGFRAVLTDQGVTKGILLADTAFVYDGGTRIDLRVVNVTFYTPLGAKDGVLTSRRGTYSSLLQRLEAMGNVIILAEDGRRLDTEQLVYDQQRNQIFTDSAFVLNQPPRQISGIGFESDPKLTVYKVHRGFKGIAPVRIPGQ